MSYDKHRFCDPGRNIFNLVDNHGEAGRNKFININDHYGNRVDKSDQYLIHKTAVRNIDYDRFNKMNLYIREEEEKYKNKKNQLIYKMDL